MKRAPRYDLPTAAPEPLRLVQLFLNTEAHETGLELLGSPAELRTWLREHSHDPGALGRTAPRRAAALRDALRTMLRGDGGTAAIVEDAARRARLTVDFRGPRLVSQAGGLDGALGTIVGVVYDAMRDGSWQRLKACRNCGWAFWDESRNRSAAWCSMQICGNRLKTRRYRRRRSKRRP